MEIDAENIFPDSLAIDQLKQMASNIMVVVKRTIPNKKILAEDYLSGLLSLYDENDEYVKGVLGLLTLGYIFPLVKRKKTPLNLNPKPDGEAIQKSFITYCRTASEMRVLINLAKDKYKKIKGYRLYYPHAFIVGDLYDRENSKFLILVVDQEIMYDDIWTGFKMFIELFFVLNCNYPLASKHVFTFVQREMFCFSTEEDDEVQSTAYKVFIKQYLSQFLSRLDVENGVQRIEKRSGDLMNENAKRLRA